jgi:hypothetical protein
MKDPQVIITLIVQVAALATLVINTLMTRNGNAKTGEVLKALPAVGAQIEEVRKLADGNLSAALKRIEDLKGINDSAIERIDELKGLVVKAQEG